MSERIGVWPTLRAVDARGLIRFLVDVVGFDEVVVYGEGSTVHHAVLRWPLGGGVMLGSVRAKDIDDCPLISGTSGIYLECDEPDELCERIRAAGTEIICEPMTTDYGSREFGVRDPEGNRWSFGTYAGEG